MAAYLKNRSVKEDPKIRVGELLQCGVMTLKKQHSSAAAH